MSQRDIQLWTPESNGQIHLCRDYLEFVLDQIQTDTTRLPLKRLHLPGIVVHSQKVAQLNGRPTPEPEPTGLDTIVHDCGEVQSIDPRSWLSKMTAVACPSLRRNPGATGPGFSLAVYSPTVARTAINPGVSAFVQTWGLDLQGRVLRNGANRIG